MNVYRSVAGKTASISEDEPGIFLEDLYVRPQFRKRVIGRALIKRLAEIAAENGWGRVEWWCLKWNKPSLEFYDALGARQMDEWVPLCLDGEALVYLGVKHQDARSPQTPEQCSPADTQ